MLNMIDILIKSKIRQKILSRFFADESRRFYINEMARLVNTTQGTCRRELNKLVDVGVLTTSKEGNLLYYQVNKQTPLYREFSAIIQKTIGIEAKLKSLLQGFKGISYAFIFGSYAKREFKAESDIDVVIIGIIEEDSLIKVFKDVERAIGREINYHIYTGKEFKSKLRTDSFIKNIIKNHIMIKGDEIAFRELF
jgi:predicted nucleotidyltransferase